MIYCRNYVRIGDSILAKICVGDTNPFEGQEKSRVYKTGRTLNSVESRLVVVRHSPKIEFVG